jgi:hypothetical protein
MPEGTPTWLQPLVERYTTAKAKREDKRPGGGGSARKRKRRRRSPKAPWTAVRAPQVRRVRVRPLLR